MAVTNFQESDFPEGEKAEEQHNPPREDNKSLEKEIENALRNRGGGDEFAKEFGSKVDDANKKLNEEISRTETPLDEQKAPKTSNRKADAEKKAAEKKADEIVEAAVSGDDEKPAARKTAAKKSGDKPTS